MICLFSFLIGILSMRYPSYTKHRRNEILCSLVFALFEFFMRNCQHRILIPVCLMAAVSDHRTGEIPDLCSIFILLYACFIHVFHPVSLLIFFVTTLLSIGKYIGFGDAKLISAWAVIFGVMTLKAVSAACFCALPFALYRQKTGQIRFAPFLCIGFLFCLISG